jgi:hypothetical protein
MQIAALEDEFLGRLFLTKKPCFMSSLAAPRFPVAKNDNKLARPPENHKGFLRLFLRPRFWQSSECVDLFSSTVAQLMRFLVFGPFSSGRPSLPLVN